MNLTFYDKICYLSKAFSLPNFHYLSYHLPAFPVYSSQIKLFNHPQEFYNELLSQASRANKRIIMASLYIGTGNLEKKLVSLISERLHCHPKLRVSCLFDYTRASRGKVNSRTLLLPLIQDNKSNCKVSLFHCPALRGIYKFLLPERWNEIIGLQHMKIYVFDNSVIVSGANLSNDYFVNRQDRYVMIKDSEELANFYEELISVVASHSLHLKCDNTTQAEGDSSLHPFKGKYRQYCQKFSDSVRLFWTSELKKSHKRLENLSKLMLEKEKPQPNTLILPTIQMPHFGLNIDSEATLDFLQSVPEKSRFRLATGYFNLTDQYVHSILHTSTSKYDILCAHPRANGFLGAKGFAGGIPAAYTHLCKRFYQKVLKYSLADRIRVYEYKKDGWTFHAKGLWYFPPNGTMPCATLIGSPNFGYRSVHRDLETQLLVSTTCPSLRREMDEEQDRLYKSSSLVTRSTFNSEDRTVPLWVKLVTYFLKILF